MAAVCPLEAGYETGTTGQVTGQFPPRTAVAARTSEVKMPGHSGRFRAFLAGAASLIDFTGAETSRAMRESLPPADDWRAVGEFFACAGRLVKDAMPGAGMPAIRDEYGRAGTAADTRAAHEHGLDSEPGTGPAVPARERRGPATGNAAEGKDTDTH